MTMTKKVLRDILSTLVDHWSWEQVNRELDRLSDDPKGLTRDATSQSGKGSLRKTPRKPKPKEILARYQLPDRIREDATSLTVMYEAKTFLPTIADVKHFLETRGKEIQGVKNRDQAFVKVIDVVLSLSPESIRQLRNSAVHGLPVRLGPISDAIGSAGDTMRAKRRD